MSSYFTCPVLVKFPPLFGDHLMGTEAGDSEVPASGHSRGRLNSRLEDEIGTATCPQICKYARKCHLSKNHFFLLVQESTILHFWTKCCYLGLTCQIILYSTVWNFKTHSNPAKRFRECAFIMVDMPIDRFALAGRLVQEIQAKRIIGLS